MHKIKTALSSGNLLAAFAVFLALGGGAFAATKVAKNSVTPKSIKDAVTGTDVKDDSLSGQDVNEASLGEVASAVQGGTGRYGFDGGCNPDSGRFVPCSVVQLPLARPWRVLVTGTARGVIEPGKTIGLGYCRIGTTSGPVDASTIAVRTDADAGGFENVTLTAVTGVFPAGTHSFGIDCSEADALYPINFSHARVTAVALSAN